MNKTIFYSCMYWLPVILILIIWLSYNTYKHGFYYLGLFIVIGIILFLFYLWFSYWLDKKYNEEKLKNKDYY